MQAITTELSKKISRLSLVASILVVILHCYSKEYAAENTGSFGWWLQETLSHGIAYIAVPFFFIVFGFFLFNSRKSYGEKIVGRVKSLLLPYVLWSLIALGLTFFVTRFARVQIYTFEWTSIKWWLEILGVTCEPKFAFHLWFVKSIFIATILSPLLSWLLTEFKIFVPIVAMLIFLFVRSLPYSFTCALVFVSLGAYFSLYPTKGPIRLSLWQNLVVGLLWLAMLFASWSFPCLSNLAKITGLVFFWFIYDNLLPYFKFNLPNISVSSFFIYCAHFPLLPYVKLPLSKLPFIADHFMIIYILTPIILISMLIFMEYILTRIAPKVCATLKGGR